MKGYIVDTKTKKGGFVEDGLPFPTFPPATMPEGVKLDDIKKLLDGNVLDRLKALEAKTEGVSP